VAEIRTNSGNSSGISLHIGDMAIRLRKLTPRIVKGLNKSISGTSRS
jgi:hypothetical protein